MAEKIIALLNQEEENLQNDKTTRPLSFVVIVPGWLEECFLPAFDGILYCPLKQVHSIFLFDKVNFLLCRVVVDWQLFRSCSLHL